MAILLCGAPGCCRRAPHSVRRESRRRRARLEVEGLRRRTVVSEVVRYVRVMRLDGADRGDGHEVRGIHFAREVPEVQLPPRAVGDDAAPGVAEVCRHATMAPDHL